MSHTKSVIELNGKKYDAISGKELTSHKVHSAASPKTKTSSARGTSVDGFFKPAGSGKIITPTRAHESKPKQVTTQQQAVKPHAAKPPVSRNAAHAKRTAQPTKTLMRHVVKKPSSHQTAPAKSTANPKIASVAAPIEHPVVRAPQAVQSQRLKQAKHIEQSPLISRFGSTAPKPVKTRTAHIPVAPVPRHAEPKQAATHRPSQTHSKTTAQQQSVVQKHIAAALEKSDSHKTPRLAKTKKRQKVAHKLGVSPRFVSSAAVTLSLLLLVGFFAYQSIPNIAVRMASAKSGFSAKLPGYSPSGFAMNSNVQAAPGIVTLSFSSNSDDRAFQISQRPSEWNSESLLSNFVESKNEPYQTFQEAGKTIFLYDDSNATWVSGGVWYQVEGNAALTSEQLLNIASSM